MPVRTPASWLVAAGATVLLAAPSAALGDATVATDRACYSPGEPIIETGTGFTPGGSVAETLTATYLASGTPALLGRLTAEAITADALGTFSRRMRAPDLARPGDRSEEMIAAFTDSLAPDAPAMAHWTLSAWDVDIAAWHGGTADPRRKMVVDTYGWTSVGGALYAHYYRGGKPFGRMRIGVTKGVCADLKKTVPQFPRRAVPAGRYDVYFSSTLALNKADDPWIRLRVVVPKRKATA